MSLAAQLVEKQDEFLGFLERRLGDRALAEDILQDAFIKSIEKEESVRDDESSVAWFYRLLRNAVIDHFRRSGARNRALELLARELQDAVEPPPEIHGAICSCVSRLANELKPEYAEAIRRIEIDGVAVHDFAHESGITPNNASVRAFRAREALRRKVQTTCGACAEDGCADCTCAH
ncbi:MAG TPA: sigma-70 family RNA polymerase sigma factor [Thermoanaerobaculia bacterium]|nr:sigma-70 family RNA polymerase sigma factor [Thermoanaerobaculia bacterium]